MLTIKELKSEIEYIYNNRYKDGFQKFIPLFDRFKNELITNIINKNVSENISKTFDMFYELKLESNNDDIEIDYDDDFYKMIFWKSYYEISIEDNIIIESIPNCKFYYIIDNDNNIKFARATITKENI